MWLTSKHEVSEPLAQSQRIFSDCQGLLTTLFFQKNVSFIWDETSLWKSRFRDDLVMLQPVEPPDLCLQLWGCQVRSWRVDEALSAVGWLESPKELVTLKNPLGM